MKFRIYKPAKSAMQSGRRNTKYWLAVPLEAEKIRSINPLMGWVSSRDTRTQLEFHFPTKEDAVKFVESQGFDYVIDEPEISSIKKKSYAANFTS